MSVQSIPASDLRHGDVLLYEHKRNQSLFVRGIRLITGSKFSHVGIVQDVSYTKLILEQLSEREYSDFHFYKPDVGEVIHIVRPRFPVPPTDSRLINHQGYGHWGIVDCLINHALGRLLFGKWTYRPMLSLLKPDNIICSALVATVLRLNFSAPWCSYLQVVEPDDYYNHAETFQYLGIVDWAA